VVDGNFSGPSVDVEPKGRGIDFASGLCVYSIPPGAVEAAHRGSTHLIDLHGDASRTRMAIDGDESLTCNLPKFSVGFVPAGCELRLDIHNTLPSTLIFIEPDTFDELCECNTEMFFLYWQRDDKIARKQQWLATAVNDPSTDPLSIETTALEIMEHMVERLNRRKDRAATRVRHRRGTLRAIDYLETHLGEPSEIAQLASAAAMSPFHFLRAFQIETGETPHQYLIRRRLEQAQHALAYSNEPVADLAARLGFCNQAHLTAAMRKNKGVTPGQIRRERIALNA
jgi:AraC-like DNA-binding protein